MVIVHSYVKLPEGKWLDNSSLNWANWTLHTHTLYTKNHLNVAKCDDNMIRNTVESMSKG